MGATAGLAMAGAGAGFSASANRQAGKAQAALANYNAQVAEIQAEDAIDRGRIAENQQRINTRRMIGAQRAALAAQGIDINDADSSAVDVQADTAYLGELDALTIRANAAREAWGYRVQAQDSRTRGAIAEAEGKNKAIGTLLTTGGSILYQRYGFGSTAKTTTRKP